ncbi:hypothetical protein [Paenibacillus odorifer]|uniref:hypothetical protein n=1 Tax=Paenibacillus odorifer TaxID=189426 RepID=UPI00096F9233|nr:hypothetical protein [Paenibacillus odorifer]OMD61033.1 hypothetical protein BSK55_06750 [Paenibacillus odorifer]
MIDPAGKLVELFNLDGYPAFMIQERLTGGKFIVPVHLLVLWGKYGIQMLLENQIRYKDGSITNFRFENVFLGNWPESLDDFFDIKLNWGEI